MFKSSHNKNIEILNILEMSSLVSYEDSDSEEESQSNSNPRSVKKGETVKIAIPPLKDYMDEEPKQRKIIKANSLLSLLPPPKSTQKTVKKFTPNVLLKKGKSPTPPLNKGKTLETLDEKLCLKVCGRKRNPPSDSNQIDPKPDVEQSQTSLNNEDFRIIVRNTKRKYFETLIDIKEDELCCDNDIVRIKTLTDPIFEPKYVTTKPVNNTCRRKHHITYLAQQAKANQQELQNQWAHNRYTRKLTQAKYGF